MTKIDQILCDMAEFYRKPFAKLPATEQIYLASTLIKEHEAEPDVFADSAGVEAFSEICHLLGAGDDTAAGEKFRLLVVAQSGVAKHYDEAVEQYLENVA